MENSGRHKRYMIQVVQNRRMLYIYKSLFKLLPQFALSWCFDRCIHFL